MMSLGYLPKEPQRPPSDTMLAGLLHRQIEPERGAGGFADALTGGEADCAAVLLAYCVADHQPQPHTRILFGFGLPEFLEDVRTEFRRNARPPIGNRNTNELVARDDFDQNRRSARRMLDRVRNQIGEDLLQTIAIALDANRLRGRNQIEFHAETLRIWMNFFRRLRDYLVQTQRMQLAVEAPCFDLGVVQN